MIEARLWVRPGYCLKAGRRRKCGAAICMKDGANGSAF